MNNVKNSTSFFVASIMVGVAVACLAMFGPNDDLAAFAMTGFGFPGVAVFYMLIFQKTMTKESWLAIFLAAFVSLLVVVDTSLLGVNEMVYYIVIGAVYVLMLSAAWICSVPNTLKTIS